MRQKDGNYKMHLEHVPSDDLVGFSDKNVLELTQRQVHMTEEIIRQYPEQWMWMHKRWKHVPVHGSRPVLLSWTAVVCQDQAIKGNSGQSASTRAQARRGVS